MKALTISAHGGLDQIAYREDVAIPELSAPTDVRVKVAAGALNRLDLFVVGGLPNVKIIPPWILGGDAAGTIESVGPGVSAVKTGDRVVLNPGVSCYACEYCARTGNGA